MLNIMLNMENARKQQKRQRQEEKQTIHLQNARLRKSKQSLLFWSISMCLQHIYSYHWRSFIYRFALALKQRNYFFRVLFIVHTENGRIQHFSRVEILHFISLVRRFFVFAFILWILENVEYGFSHIGNSNQKRKYK